MTLVRRHYLALLGIAAVAPTLSQVAIAQTYPARPVRIIIGFGAGSSPDITSRLMGEWLSQRLGQQFVIENRPGAGGNIAAEAVVRAPADGHTLLWVAAANTVSTTLYSTANFNLIRDIRPVAGVTRVQQVMQVNPLLPANTVPEFIAYAKANPGKINMASTGSGNMSHLSGELFKMMVGIEMAHVPYRGAPAAITDLIRGEVHVMFDSLPSSIEHIRVGRLRALAVTSAKRWEGLPDLPTLAEFIPNYEANVWSGMGAPQNTPNEIVERLNREVNAGLADPTIKMRLSDLGVIGFGGSPEEFGKLIAEDTVKWAKVVKFFGLKAN